ncbi:hypothetical protein CSPX01_16631 [Colletotrichum filicis]|nr:hypothetical protein CSPX01_16631 [Colletotrichum filicis]
MRRVSAGWSSRFSSVRPFLSFFLLENLLGDLPTLEAGPLVFPRYECHNRKTVRVAGTSFRSWSSGATSVTSVSVG